MAKAEEGYFRRAVECLAFAKSARDEEERVQLLVMANNLRRIAIDRSRRALTLPKRNHTRSSAKAR
jgi:hypothetical protein